MTIPGERRKTARPAITGGGGQAPESDLTRKRILAGQAALASGLYWLALAAFTGMTRALELPTINPGPMLLILSGAAGLIAINFVYVRTLMASDAVLGFRGVTMVSTAAHAVLTLFFAIADGFGMATLFILLVGTPVVQVFFGLNYGMRATLLFGLLTIAAFSLAYVLAPAQEQTMTLPIFQMVMVIVGCLTVLSAVVNGRARAKKYMIVQLLREQQERNQLIEEQNRKLEQQSRELRRMSMIDGLTGVANRRHFEESLEREWQRSRRAPGRHPLALIMVDVDHFKAFNDVTGHTHGDDCLIRIAQALETAAARPPDLAARYGGEEFSLLLPDTDMEGATAIAGRIREHIRELDIPHPAFDDGRRITVSQGVAVIEPELDREALSLVKRCDQALYRAKAAGRDCIEVANGPETQN